MHAQIGVSLLLFVVSLVLLVQVLRKGGRHHQPMPLETTP
jgi:hypothetical protein